MQFFRNLDRRVTIRRAFSREGRTILSCALPALANPASIQEFGLGMFSNMLARVPSTIEPDVDDEQPDEYHDVAV